MRGQTWLQRHGWALALWSLTWFLFFFPLLTGQSRLPNSDFSGQFHAFGLFQAQEVSAGHLPVWSPGSYGGFPFAADTQSAVFYPLRWLTILLSLPWGFTYQALQLEGLLHIWLAGVFTYFLAHNITKERWSSLIAAIALGLGGYLTSYPLLQLAVLETFVWLPLVLLLLRLGVKGQRPLPYLLAAGITLGISALAGHPQTFLHASYLAAAYFLFLTGQARWTWRWRLGLGALIAVTTVGATLAGWLPAWHYLAFTTRSETGYDFVAKGFPLLDYWQLLVPGPFSVWLPQYVGVTAVILTLIAWWGRKKGQHAEILLWSGAAFLTAWLSLGDKGILFELIYRIAPGFSLFRQQERLINIVCLSLALLAAQGLAIWLKASAAQRGDWLRRTAIVMGAGFILAGTILAGMRTAITVNWPLIWLRQGMATAVALALFWQVKQKHWLGLGLALLLGFDLYWAVLPTLDLQPQESASFWQQPDWLAAIPTTEPARIDSGHLFHANLGEAYGLEDIGGISPLKPQVLDALETVPRERLWQLLNVQYILSAQSQAENSNLKQVAVIDGSLLPDETAAGFVYENESALPRAWMSYQPVAAPDAAAALEQLQSPNFDPAASVILHPPLPDLSQIAPPDNPPQVEPVRQQANELAITVTTDSPGLLVLSEWAYPGWRATVNGRAATLYPANYAFQALLLPAGTHEIRLRFVPTDVIVGSVLSLMTLLAAGFIAWRWQPVVPLRPTNQPFITLPHASILRRGSGQVFNPSTRLRTSLQSLAFLQKQWPLLVLVLLGFGLRVFLLGSQELRGDEAFSYLFAGQPVGEIIGDLLREGDPHSPFHYLLLHGWMALAGTSEFAMRFLSLIPGVLLIPLTYRLGRLLGEKRVGWLTAVFITLSQSQIWLAQDVRNQYTLTLFFTALATLLLVQVTQVRHTRKTAVTLAMWTAYAVSAALAVYSYYYGIFALLAHGLFLLFDRSRRRYWLWWLGSGVTAVALFAIWFIPMWPQLVRAGQVGDPSQPELAKYLTAVGIELTTGSALDGWLVRWLFLLTLGLCLFGIRVLWGKQRGWAIMLAGWLGSAALGIFLVQFSRSTFNDFYISVAAPAWWLLTAVGLIELYRRRGWFQLAAAISVLLWLVASVASLGNYYFDPTYSRTQGYRAAAAHISSVAGKNDLFLAHFPDPALDYYLRDVPLPRQMQPAKSGLPSVETEQALAQLAASYDRIWFIPYHHSVWDRDDVVPRWLDFHTLVEQRTHFERLELAGYRPLSSIDAVMVPLGAKLENQAVLDGVFVTVDGQPAAKPTALPDPLVLMPGAALDVTLIWQTQQPIPEGYTVFVHLLNDQGALLVQHDGIPASGTLPTPLWPVGERLLDGHSLIVPPEVTAVNGRLIAGMYNTKTLTRQTFADGQDFITIVEVVFTR